MNQFATGLKRNISFVIKNISSIRRDIRIFNHKIKWNQERDLMAIPGIAEDDIKASLTKGELRQRLEMGTIEIVSTNIAMPQDSQAEVEFLVSKGIPNVQVDPGSSIVALGNVSGNVTLDLTQGNVFTGNVIGNTVFAVINGSARSCMIVDLTMAGAGGYTIAFNGAGGLTVVDPGGLGQVFVTTTPGNRSVGLWMVSSVSLYALGYNSS